MDGLAIGKFEDVCLRPVPLVYLLFGPQECPVINSHNVAFGPLLPFPPLFLRSMGSHPTDRLVLVSFLLQICPYCSVCRGGRGQGNNQPRRRTRGKAVRDVIHHHGPVPPALPLPSPFVFPSGKCAVAMFTDRDQIQLPAIACGQALLCVLCFVNLLTALPPSTIGSKHRAKPFGLHMRLPRYAACGPPSTHPSMPSTPFRPREVCPQNMQCDPTIPPYQSTESQGGKVPGGLGGRRGGGALTWCLPPVGARLLQPILPADPHIGIDQGVLVGW